LVQRILSELKICHEKGERNNIVINKCWNVIRQIVEIPTFIPTLYNQIEEQLKPLFQFIIEPTKIEFEDEIVLVLKTFIKKTHVVSNVLWEMFPYLEKVFEKNKQCFGNLLDTLNYFLIYGKEGLAVNRNNLGVLISLASKSLFSTEPNITIQNSEGAILFQLLFQVYAGT
jgi:hypothetical protein